ncbi:hypothetical protein [Kumtagia ephedrae]|jgi:hypothetical protein|uniref:Uncharacterized protein n=1 Tax=Kumtagia ephedrae TaxID=2116701 RepID=A0A2P7SF56_9HYPH|nr:hypothetical protein [Mesorhizobium ephedrae]PSJ61132.1 hypothetical protein C7I84_10595 [Mesorhizobium ephedrae]
MQPRDFSKETAQDREMRLRRQAEDRANLVNDHMELIYSGDLDEVFAELVRLHRIVQDPRTAELMARVFADRLGGVSL